MIFVLKLKQILSEMRPKRKLPIKFLRRITIFGFTHESDEEYA
ncbi:hypothetical protein QWZ13_04380 [Reinekea marina]|nr:hypothetical protein [Reinekea marina]MDN3648141.1 hypothetical protein [Reinekea marina]